MSAIELSAARLREPSFWQGLDPGLHVHGPVPEPWPVADHREAVRRDLQLEGYFHLGPTVPEEDVASLLRAILSLREAGLPPVFVFAWDEAWHLFTRLDALWRTVLDDWRFLPAFYAWYVAPGADSSGWKPHQDRAAAPHVVAADGRPASLSVWVALTQATPLNGCMYVIPSAGVVPRITLQHLHEVRALPAAAGSVLGWHQRLWHWGGKSSHRAAGPRVSASFELQRADAAPVQRPLLDPNRLPDLPARLALIAAQLIQYHGMAPMDQRLRDLAQGLLARP